MAKVKKVIGVASVVLGAVQTEGEANFQVLALAMREYYFIKDTFFSDLEDLPELQAGLALEETVSLVLAEHPYSIRDAAG